MSRVVDLVKSELNFASAWMTTTEVCEKLQRSRGSVGRALRRLESRDAVKKQKVPGDQKGNMEWALPSKVPLPDAAPQLRTKKPKIRLVRVKHPPKILSINFTNQGDLQMHIETGAEAIVVEWVTAEKTFSAHDVTDELRKRVNDGSATLDPVLAGTTHVGGKDVTKVEHALVKVAVTKLMSGNRFPDYVREHNPAGFYEYKPIAKSAGSTPAAATGAAPAVADGSTYDGDSTL